MDERDLQREIEHYAQAFSRAADEHQRERTPDALASLISRPAPRNRATRMIVVAAVLVTIAATATVAVVSRSSSAHRVPPVATTPTDLAPCRPNYWLITDTYEGMNAGIRRLDQRLVPIDATKVRLCRYDFVTNGYPLLGSIVLDGTVAKSFEAETNRLSTIPLAKQPICHGPKPLTGFVATYARERQRVQLDESGCGYVTNGVLAGLGTAGWITEITDRTPSTTSRMPTTEACTIADLEARGNMPAPTPEIVTRHIAFHSGSFAQIDPPGSTPPTISAAQAWAKVEKPGSGFVASPRGTYEILLGKVTSLSEQNRLAWLIVGHHVPFVGSGGPDSPPGVTRPPEPPCSFVDVLVPIDATTGQSLFFEAGGDLDPR